jgi:hypothetical protein
MKKIHAFAFASMLASSTAVMADEPGYDEGPGYGETGCNPHPTFSEGFKNPGAMFRAARNSEVHSGANPAVLAAALDLKVGGLLKAVCVENDPS